MIKATTALLAILGTAALTGAAGAAIRHVPGQYASIQAAIDAAVNGDEVLVAEGVYQEAINFRGKAIVVRSGYLADGQPDWNVIADTVIDATGIDASVVTFDSGEGLASRLEGLTVRGGTGEASSVRRGGGVYLKFSGPTIRYCVMADNHADFGGGICAVGSWSEIEHCVIRNNVAIKSGECGGGGIGASASYMAIRHSRIEGNAAPGAARGGGFAIWGGSMEVTNSLFLDNTAYYGGGIISAGGDALIRNCTIVGNTAVIGGGGMCVNYSSAEVTIANSILWNNAAANGNDLFESADPVIVVHHSCSEQGLPGEGNRNVDPRFVNAEAGDLHLAPDSDLIDAGDDGEAFDIGIDLDGKARIMASAVDFGVYESEQASTACTADLDGSGTVEFDDLVTVLSAWGACSGCPEDLDGSGDVGFTEVTMVLSSWGPCP